MLLLDVLHHNHLHGILPIALRALKLPRLRITMDNGHVLLLVADRKEKLAADVTEKLGSLMSGSVHLHVHFEAV